VAQQRQVYSFEGVGESTEAYKKRVPTAKLDIPVGIKTPISFNDGGKSLFSMHYSTESQLRDNLRNLLNTNHGERIMLPHFGANIQELAWEVGTEDGDKKIMSRIQTAVSKFMPFIALEGYEPIRDLGNNNEISKTGIRLIYGVPAIDLTNQALEIILNIAG